MKFNTTDQIKDIVSGVKVPSALGLFFVLATTALLAKKVKARAALKDAYEYDELDKDTEAVINRMVRGNRALTQHTDRRMEALAVGHNKLVRKVRSLETEDALHVRVRCMEVMGCLLMCVVVVMAFGLYHVYHMVALQLGGGGGGGGGCEY